jgi:hypothetical protein
MVGASAATIQSIELGRLRLSPALANRICVATGADPHTLLHPRGRPRDVCGKPYTPASFAITKHEPLNGDDFEKSCKRALLFLEALLRAAKSPQKLRSRALLFSFQNWLQTARKEFGLKTESPRMLRELTEEVSETGGRTWMEWTTAAYAIVNERGNVLLAEGNTPEPWEREDAGSRARKKAQKSSKPH